jgi:hypothetical protein
MATKKESAKPIPFFLLKGEPEKKPLVANWLKTLCFIIAIIDIFLSGSGAVESGSAAISAAVGPTIIGVAIAFISAGYCAKWATKIKKNPNVAYGIGFFLGILGLVIYGIYYRTKKRQSKA